MKKLFLLCVIPVISILSGCKESGGDNETYDITIPDSTQKLIFIHHSCGANWLSDGDGNLGSLLNANNYYVTEAYYGWCAETEDYIGDHTNTEDWPDWFNDTKMPYVYSNNATYFVDNSIADPGTENNIIMFKSCYPCSEAGDSIADEKAVYNSLLTYFGNHTDKLFILITPPGEAEVGSYLLTRELCQWLTDEENGWLADYPYNNVGVFDFYCVLSETGSHHRITGGSLEYIYASDYDGTSPYHTGDDHPNSAGNQKAAAEYITLLNYYYNRWMNQ